MKKLLCMLLMVTAGISAASAQTEKGRWTVGASVGSLSYQDQYNSRSLSGSFSPLAGYFAANNLVAGLGFPVSFSNGSNKNVDYSYVSTSIGLSPFLRYYFGQATLRPYAGLSYTHSTTNQHINNANQNRTENGFSSSLSPTVGLAYFINNTVALNAGLSYVASRYNTGSIYYDAAENPVEPPTSTSNYLTLNIGFQLFFGK